MKRKSRVSQDKQDRLIDHYVAGITSRVSANLFGINNNSLVYYYLRLRVQIRAASEDGSPFYGDIVVAGSYFDDRCIGKRGRSAARKVHFKVESARVDKGLFNG